MIIKYFQIYKRKYRSKIGILKQVVAMFYEIQKEFLGTWKSAKTWKLSMGISLFKVSNRNTNFKTFK